ncbi:MAG TPA: hypothetical protein VGM23_18270 [Armatimonadota bacterium]
MAMQGFFGSERELARLTAFLDQVQAAHEDLLTAAGRGRKPQGRRHPPAAGADRGGNARPVGRGSPWLSGLAFERE